MAEGVVVSFYSYKGGVGRTFALANVATTLARWGYRVLCVDWDLEAPGLSNYFGRWLTQPQHGLLDLVEDIAAGHSIGQRQLTNIVPVPGCGDRLALIPALRDQSVDLGTGAGRSRDLSLEQAALERRLVVAQARLVATRSAASRKARSIAARC